MRTLCAIMICLFSVDYAFSQGYNHIWFIGNQVLLDTNTTSPKARILFDGVNADTIGEIRQMPFRGTQANISDENGNLIAATNGCWIMDATGNTMQNGSGLNPGSYANSYCTNTSAIPISNGALFIPFPGDSTKFILFHQVGNFNMPNGESSELFYTVIDRTLNSGNGGVIPGQKNLIAFTDTLSYGIAACKHANGRDWWVLALKDSSNVIYKVLVTPAGIASVTTQTVNMPLPYFGNAGQPCFSPEGTKFAFTSGRLNPFAMDVRVFSFNRCNGILDSIGYIHKQNYAGFGLSFSPNSRYLYYSAFQHIFQLDTDAPDIAATDTLIAIYDGYCYPFSATCTDFWLMYRAANGKIYITSSQYTIDLTYINSPDSAGVACDVKQHALRLPCYTIRQGLNHPNYYLGCDTTCGPCFVVGVNETGKHDFKFSLSPNPSSGAVKIIYLLPQNKSGMFELYDVTGKKVFTYILPPWSTLQHFDFSFLSNGMYHAVLTSDGFTKAEKLVLLRP